MSTIFQKYYAICIVILVPLLLISNAKFENNLPQTDSEVFSYDLYCCTKFKTDTETSYNGTKFSVLNLHIEAQDITSKHSVEFIISKEGDLGEIGPGKYRVTKDNDGFLKYLDGVFGFLDNKDSGELPFFAHIGEITIAEIDDKEVNGHMNVYFKNAVGHSIHIQGSFVGRP